MAPFGLALHSLPRPHSDVNGLVSAAARRTAAADIDAAHGGAAPPPSGAAHNHCSSFDAVLGGDAGDSALGGDRAASAETIDPNNRRFSAV